ncbi:RimJ/RimL family protein N-acetyltransferase [Actinomadura pelletieri DSM 43383]|uniref:RimJ/RimL family protein N-acetyltransferase n=1 Tax=Actinomadura pelletieri DSM 43383 TaxID=1120940 RepID=A0A495QS61_9ACTN|nr:GNAT family protein [Actinomadura pelletieri]RKS76221.1 RimJ/RimL family protein N-acetyltransferase [Actinomadura pelletieri DSM 43383]
MFALRLADDAELRPLEPWNAAEFAEHAVRVRKDIDHYIPWARTVVDEATAQEFLRSYAVKQAKDIGRIYGIWVDGVLQGGTLFRTFDAAMGVCEAGVWLSSEARGRGLVTTAVRHMIDWAFRARGMHRVEWLCDPRNTASAAVAKRLGMTCEGVHRQGFVLDGDRRDVQVWAILADEWGE